MIPLLKPIIPVGWEKYFQKSVDASQLTNFGPCHDELIERLTTRLNGFPVVSNSGASALQLALHATVPMGSLVGVPDYTHIGTINAVLAAGCSPVIIGMDSSTWTVDRSYIDSIDALVVVSPFGYPVDFKAYDEWATQMDVKLVYDLAGAWGMKVETKNPYAMSFHATKNFSVGEGGVCVFSSEDHAAKARLFSFFGINRSGNIMTKFGHNMKMPEITAAMCLAHLDREQDILDRANRKKELAMEYSKRLGKTLPKKFWFNKSAPSLCVLGGFDVSEVNRRATKNDLIVKAYYPLLSDQVCMMDIPKTGGCGDPFFRSCVALPCDVTEEEFEKVCEVIR